MQARRFVGAGILEGLVLGLAEKRAGATGA